MSKIRYSFAIIIVACALLYAHAGQSGLTAFVTQLPVINDLPSNSINVTYNDADGFIWFGTDDGLCRYDGYRVKTWRSNLFNDSLLTDNGVLALVEDSNHNLLIGTKHGLNMMNGKRTDITRPSDRELLDYEVRAIVPDVDNSIWVGTFKRLVKASASLENVKKYDTSLPVTSVNTVYRDNEDNIWVAFWHKGLYKYNRVTDRFEKISKIGTLDNPMRMKQIGDSYLIGTWGEGLWLMKKGSSGYEVSQINLGENSDTHKDIYGITTDREERVWMISQGGVAVGIFDGNDMQLLDTAELSAQMNNRFNRIVTDMAGNIWISATHEGAYIITQNIPIINHISIDDKIKSNLTGIYNNGKYILFNQTLYGLGLYDKQNKTVVRNFDGLYQFDDLKEVSLIKAFDNNPSYLYLAPKYFPYLYVVQMDGSNLRLVKRIHLENVGDAGAPRQIAMDSDGNIYIATDKQLLSLRADGSMHQIDKNISDVQSLYVDSDGRLWVASLTKGIIVYYVTQNNNHIRVSANPIKGTENQSIVSMAADNETDTIWVVGRLGNVLGIDRKTGEYDDKTEKIKMFPSEYLQDIVIDTENNKWLSTAKSLYRFSPGFERYTQYDISDSKNKGKSLNKGAVHYSPTDNLIYYGCNDGLIAVRAIENNSIQTQHPIPVLTDVKISGNSIFDNCINRFDFGTKEIHLPADAKDIQFEFSTLEYANSENIRFQYRITDIDDDWRSFEYGRPLSIYNHIPQGKHTLEIRATTMSGEWSAPNSYVIHKTPAWYETWWAYMLYFLLVCIVFVFLYIYFKKRMTEKNEIRLAQLDKKNTEELTEMKLKYFANISHDFLTPITIISCLVDDIETVYGKIGPHLDKIRFNLTKVKSLIQQILDYRKMETGNMRLSVSENDLCDFIDRICRNHFQPLMDKKHINFTYDQDCEPIVGYFDIDKVEKILFNLISNAYKYTPDGGSIDVAVRKKLCDGQEFAIIRISDTGIGISKKNLEKIFNRFYTVGRDEQVESNGIGLSLVKDLLELHHGSISAESTLGKGSTFTLQFPVSKDCFSYDEIEDVNNVDINPSSHHPQNLETLDADSEPSNRDITLLLVEDNEELLSIMSKIFARTYHVLVAHNGKEALDVIGKNDVDIVVSDVMMPEMDGLELCNHLKSDIKTSHIPIILLTAKSRPEDRVECYKAGADGYIAKPFELPVLVARIDNFIKNKQNQQEKFKDTPEVDAGTLELSTLDKEFLDKVISLVNEHIEDEAFDIDALANEVCMSRSSLYRKIKVITGMSPVELVRNTKLKRSYELLKEGRMNISQVAYAAGFSNPKYFSTCFKEQFGISPRDVSKS